MNFRAFDLDYLDIDRAKVFLHDLAGIREVRVNAEAAAASASATITLPVRPQGRSPRYPQWPIMTLRSGMIVEGVSKSKFWPQTAIFVLEDDAQNGPDHVDSHRSPAFVLSPYTRREAHRQLRCTTPLPCSGPWS